MRLGGRRIGGSRKKNHHHTNLISSSWRGTSLVRNWPITVKKKMTVLCWPISAREGSSLITHEARIEKFRKNKLTRFLVKILPWELTWPVSSNCVWEMWEKWTWGIRDRSAKSNLKIKMKDSMRNLRSWKVF